MSLPMPTVVLRNAEIINEGRRLRADVLIRAGRIERIGTIPAGTKADQEYDLTGKLLLPGLIDDQVHFREPGLTHKACIASEARAAVAGGVAVAGMGYAALGAAGPLVAAAAAIGAVVAGIVAWISIRWLLNYVARNNFVAFGYYRILAGIVIIALVIMRVLPA